MNKLKHWIRRNFGFSQREVNAFLVLLTLLVLLLAAPFLLGRMYTSDPGFTTAQDRQLLDSLVAQLEAAQPERESKYKVATVALRPFNPNQLSLEEWQAFGLPKYLAQRILNYRSKVGDLTYKAELGRIYGMPDSVFQRLHPYIELPVERPSKYNRRPESMASSRPSPQPEWHTKKRERFILAPFNINTADTTQLKQIRGIGSKLSARIVKYRNGLGGFHSMEQLREVYGLQPEVVDSLHKYTFVPKSNTLQQLSINAATADELRSHPYITPNVARAIVAYREQHGKYEQLEDVRQVKLVTAELYEKIRPYLAL
ncbi:competence ComEA-like helix-hairpin-helix protein [Pontibacter mucosus]|uniref:Competence ComEA-like helix-hairpin-helix protein n=1 Tax=Pontibacter mucosus TaxID=1649266 RepID=A0A2T5YJZ5_9BACT|nr:helix-hairpin-helix domain-containing protein [Pontibacter mucosus]PTX19630.1 competence ComEA-like helix-hairpin-helix protein [Pontibacter mucosus]